MSVGFTLIANEDILQQQKQLKKKHIKMISNKERWITIEANKIL